MNPERDKQRRIENGLSIWIQEAKGVSVKRRYFCELCLDRSLYARTSFKAVQTGSCFWGEYYEFTCLPPLDEVCINLYRVADPKKKKDRNTLIGYVPIQIEQLVARQPVEKWYPVLASTSPPGQSKNANGSNNSGAEQSIRVRARYQTVDILPLRVYDRLLTFLRSHYLVLCRAFEPLLGVKAKEDFATSLVRILHRQRISSVFLCELAMCEAMGLDNDHLLFRGNTLATKAMESYMKLVAADYLQITLGDYVQRLLASEENCEVDPLKLNFPNSSSATSSNSSTSSSSTSSSMPVSATLQRNRNNLTAQVEIAWSRILGAIELFPQQLRQVFHLLRQKLEQGGRGDLADNAISSSIFLRFLCPAILSPSLFNLVSEYPSGMAARNLTLIAKTLQTLANFTKFGGKESYMEFMDDFVERQWNAMQLFLRQISTVQMATGSAPTRTASDEAIDAEIDLGKELSLLHSYIQESWSHQIQVNNADEEVLSELWSIVVAISTYKVCGHFSNGADTPSSCNNPPSDYENNGVIIQRPPAQQQQNQPQPSVGPNRSRTNGREYASPIQAAPATPRGSLAAHSLYTSDDYVLGNALNDLNLNGEEAQRRDSGNLLLRFDASAKLKGGQNGYVSPFEVFDGQRHVPYKSTGVGTREASTDYDRRFHLYDETPVADQEAHLYDEVPDFNEELPKLSTAQTQDSVSRSYSTTRQQMQPITASQQLITQPRVITLVERSLSQIGQVQTPAVIYPSSISLETHGKTNMANLLVKETPREDSDDSDDRHFGNIPSPTPIPTSSKEGKKKPNAGPGTNSDKASNELAVVAKAKLLGTAYQSSGYQSQNHSSSSNTSSSSSSSPVDRGDIEVKCHSSSASSSSTSNNAKSIPATSIHPSLGFRPAIAIANPSFSSPSSSLSPTSYNYSNNLRSANNSQVNGNLDRRTGTALTRSPLPGRHHGVRATYSMADFNSDLANKSRTNSSCNWAVPSAIRASASTLTEEIRPFNPYHNRSPMVSARQRLNAVPSSLRSLGNSVESFKSAMPLEKEMSETEVIQLQKKQIEQLIRENEALRLELSTGQLSTNVDACVSEQQQHSDSTAADSTADTI